MKEKNTQLIGDDGELLVAVKVEKPKYQTENPNLNRRLILLVMAIGFIFGGTALAVIVMQTVMKGAVAEKPSIAVVPARFSNALYQVGFSINIDKKNPVQLPCDSRRIRVQVAGNVPLTVHLWAVSDDSTFDQKADLRANARSTVFDVPAFQGNLFNIELVDAQNKSIAGLEKLNFGTTDFRFCEIGVNFETIKGLK